MGPIDSFCFCQPLAHQRRLPHCHTPTAAERPIVIIHHLTTRHAPGAALPNYPTTTRGATAALVGVPLLTLNVSYRHGYSNFVEPNFCREEKAVGRLGPTRVIRCYPADADAGVSTGAGAAIGASNAIGTVSVSRVLAIGEL